MASVDRILECSMCLEKFKDPRILSCFHTFCRECLVDYVAKSKRVETSVIKFDCPVCRASITLPSNGVDGLQKNFYLDQEQPKHPICSLHKAEDLRFYCRECHEKICRDCKVVSHEGHSTGMADDVATEMRNELDDVFSETEKAINENEIRQRAVVETDLGSLETTLAVVEINTGMMKNEIDRLFVYTKNLLTPHIKSKKQRACVIEKAYAEKLNALRGYRVLLTEADSKDGRDIFQVHKEFKDSENDILELKEPPLSLEPKDDDKDEGCIDNSKIVNMFDQLRDILRDKATQLKGTNFSCDGSNKSISAKRLPSDEEGDISSVPQKKQKESDVKSINQKEHPGNSRNKIPTSSSSIARTNTAVPSLFTSLTRAPVSVRPTHEVKPVVLPSTSSTASLSNSSSRSGASDSNIYKSIFSVNDIPGKSQGQSVNKDSGLVNASRYTVTVQSKDNQKSNSTPSLGSAVAPGRPSWKSGPRKLVKRNTSDDPSRRQVAPNTNATIEHSRVALIGGGTFQKGETYLVKDKIGHVRKMTFTSGRLVDVPRYVPTNTFNSTVIEGARVELKGGSGFEKGQAYLVKNKLGEEKKMIWTGTTLVEVKGIAPYGMIGRNGSPSLPIHQTQRDEPRPSTSGLSSQGTTVTAEAPKLSPTLQSPVTTPTLQSPVTTQNIESRSSTPDVVRTVRSDLHMSDSSESDCD